MSISRNNSPAHESRVFQPSSFASRKAERAARGELAPRPRRLVSLGINERALEGFRPARQGGQVVRVELLADLDDLSQKFQRHLPYGSVEPLMHIADDPAPEHLGVIRGDGISSGTFPSALATPPAEIIT